jgi:glycosyltransferase involved in cell wall biosynthesis
LKIIFFTFYYPPDLSAGSFRAISLVKALSKKICSNDELHIITTHPNRYSSHKVLAKDIELNGNIVIHRMMAPNHHSSMISQSRTFYAYAVSAYRLCKQLDPDFIIGTTGRLMTGVLAGISAHRARCRYFIDLRDIFSETISDIFSRKNKTLGKILKTIFSFLDKRLFNGASGVNVVSEGFPEYFQNKGIDTSNWSFFPNGVDIEFTNLPTVKSITLKKVITILYAGNIGSGQGLETILPDVAERLSHNYRFLVIGDGGTRESLEKKVRDKNIDNIIILPPVERDKLIKYYQNADILFLHLNDIPAFRRVLPSKIFEYAALGKPIVAGLSGYSAKFMKDNLQYASVFNPGDVEGACSSIHEVSNLIIPDNIVTDFIEHYERKSIMDKMAKHILNIANKYKNKQC